TDRVGVRGEEGDGWVLRGRDPARPGVVVLFPKMHQCSEGCPPPLLRGHHRDLDIVERVQDGQLPEEVSGEPITVMTSTSDPEDGDVLEVDHEGNVREHRVGSLPVPTVDL